MKRLLLLVASYFLIFTLTVPRPSSYAQNDGWTWLNPLPQGNALRALWGTAPNHIYAVGEQGVVMHYDGSSWQILANVPGKNALLGVWGAGPNDIFAVGVNALWHYDGASWEAMNPPAGMASFRMRSAWGTSGHNVYAAGYLSDRGRGAIFRFDGVRWSSVATTSRELRGLWGSGPDDIYAVGDSSHILHYDGTSWKDINQISGADLVDVWGSGPNDVYVVGRSSATAGGVVFHYDGDAWKQVFLPSSPVVSIWGFASDDIYILDDFSTVYHFDGSSWQEIGVATRRTDRLYDIWGVSPNDLFAVGRDGVVAHFDGSQWQNQVQGPDINPYSVWTDGQRVVIVGEGPEALVYDGSQWTLHSLPREIPDSDWVSAHAYDVWGTSWNHLYAVGDGLIWRFDGQTWSRVHSVLNDEGDIAVMEGIWGFGPNDIYAVGYTIFPSEQIIVHYDGAQWSTVYQREGEDGLYDVWGSGPNDVFVAAGDDGMLHYDGQAWSQMDANSFDSVWGAGPDHVFATGEHPTTHTAAVFHYDGNQWQVVYDEDVSLESVWGLGPDDVYAVGNDLLWEMGLRSRQAVLLHYDGSQWTRWDTPYSVALEDIEGTENMLLMVGSGGTILGRGDTPPPLSVWTTPGPPATPTPTATPTPLPLYLPLIM